MFSDLEIQKFAKQEVCSKIDMASAWGIGGLKSPDYNDNAEPWIGLYGACKNPTQHLIYWYSDCLTFE